MSQLSAIVCFIVTCVGLVDSMNSSRVYSCEFANSKCHVNLKCDKLLTNYRVHCVWSRIQQPNGTCSSDCKTALALMAHNQVGQEFLNCDCVHNDFCRHVQANIRSKCPPSRDDPLVREPSGASLKWPSLFCISTIVVILF
ncbi:hypothetical protein HDE_09243 [Halotydeus destructor]|nr:hypothetical protein HDE_09243 [Halotydeus destructor]